MSGRIRAVLEYALVFCIILEFNTPYTVFPLIKRTVQILPAVLLSGLILFSHYSVKKRVNAYVLIYLAGALLPMLVLEGGAYFAYIKCYVLILPLMWIYLYLRKDAGTSAHSLFLRYSNLMVVLAFISLAMWILCSLIRIIPPTTMFPYEWSPGRSFIPTYFGIYFETQSTATLGWEICRNTGIFNEGPMYNMALCTALIIECFIRPVKSKGKIAILAVTVLSTLTTTGQLFLLFLGGWYFYKKVKKRRFLLILILPLLLYVGFIATNVIMDNKRETGGAGSVDLRGDDIRACLEIGLKHPLMGVGLVSKEEMTTVSGDEAGFSNSLFNLFARGGLYALALYVGALLFIPFLYFLKFKDSRWLVCMFCFFMLFTITSIYLKYLTLLFLSWGLSNIELRAGRMPRRIQIS